MMLIRLGKVDRRLLLEAAANQPGWTPLPVIRDNAAHRIVRDRSRHKLLSLGLIEVRWFRAETGAERMRCERDRHGYLIDIWDEPVRIERVQDFRLSPQGLALIDAYRKELEAGGRIRWGKVPAPKEAKLFQTEMAHNRRGGDGVYGPYYDRFKVVSPVDHRAGSDIGWPILKDPDDEKLWETICDDEEKLARCVKFAKIYDEEHAAVQASFDASGKPMSLGAIFAILEITKDRARARWASDQLPAACCPGDCPRPGLRATTPRPSSCEAEA